MGILFCSDSDSEVFTSTFYFESTDWNYSFGCSLSGVRLKCVEQHRDCVCVCVRACVRACVRVSACAERERERERENVCFVCFSTFPQKVGRLFLLSRAVWILPSRSTDGLMNTALFLTATADEAPVLSADNLDTFFSLFSKDCF